MSFLPIYNSLATGALVVCLFLWEINLLPYVLLLFVVSLIFMWLDLFNYNLHYVSAFWLFIVSEVMAFGSLIACCFWFDNCYFINLSSPLEIPLVGSFILLGSSITVTGYHHLLGWSYDWVLLLLTIFLGASFVVLQIIEMNEISVIILDSAFHASSFCTVGLHFSHVILGVAGLTTVLLLSSKVAGHYRCTIITWYWHFVDYIWLFVYTFVYVC
uniref:Cytochrome c oxidase subunit 3 n=1 Tax=Dollfusiella sp. MZUSP 7992 TaxID=2899499 RepID=A0A8K1W583_9CEST|nr:cytochrome c oxidase subunit III [Dollfusiella sp. MZUSP 7992]